MSQAMTENILSDRLFNERTKVENDSKFLRAKEFNDAATLVLRYLSHDYFKDMKPGDWFEAYSSISKSIYEAKLTAVVSKSKGESSLSAALLPMLESQREQVLEVVYSGGNYNLDPALPPSTLASKSDSQATRNEKHKRVAIYADEIDKIVDILWNRLRAVSTDEVYFLGEFTPKEKYRCYVVDVALVWTLLALNLKNPITAEPYITEIVGRALERSGVETSGTGAIANLLSNAKAFVELHLESARNDETWFPYHMIWAFSFVYDVPIEETPAKTDQRRALGYTAAGLGPHIWPLFADVSNALGDNVSRKWLRDLDCSN